MNHIRVFATAHNNQIRVYANDNFDAPAPVAIDIALDPSTRENLIRAELLAMRFAMSEIHMGGIDRAHGIGVSLTCSYGAIRKLTRKESAFAELAPYAQFLCTRYSGAEVQVENRRPAWADDSQVIATYQLDGTPVFESVAARFGQFIPTCHAVERMVERGICTNAAKAYQTLSNHFAGEYTVEMEWNSDASKRCRAKYGKFSRLVYHKDSRAMYVITQDKHLPFPAIVTAYKVNRDDLGHRGIEKSVA